MGNDFLNFVGEEEFNKIVGIEEEEEKLKKQQREITSQLTMLRKKKKEICSHPSLYKFGRVEESEPGLFLSKQFSSAKLKRRICGTGWDEKKDGMEKLQEIVSKALEVAGTWQGIDI
ncbi:MAG: hypothetical protein ACOCQR_00940 [bacterium]